MLAPNTEAERKLWSQAQDLLMKYKTEGDCEALATVVEIQEDNLSNVKTALVYLSDGSTFEFNPVTGKEL